MDASQRLNSSILDGVDLPRHPFTGMQALGVLPSGRIMWPIAGASDDNDDDDDKSKDKDKDDDADNSGDGDDDKGGGSSGGDPDKDKPSGAPTREEFDRLFSRMQAADRRAAEAERRVREAEDKDKTELEKAQRDLKERDDEVAGLKGMVKQQAVRLAFFSAASHITWHDPEDALAFALKDLDDLEVKEDGTVDRNRVKTVADALAKSKPYLVKTATDADDDKDGKGKKGKSGDQPDDKDGKGKLDRAKLAEKFPALRR